MIAEANAAQRAQADSDQTPLTATEPEAHAGSGHAPLGSDIVSVAAARLSTCCHGGAKMAVLAYSLGKREINQYFTIKNAKLLSVAAVVILTVFHTASRHYGGGDTCDWLLSSGRFLGDNVWQPYGCMLHKYKSTEAKLCLREKRIAFVGDSRIRQLFYSFIKMMNPEVKEVGNKDFLWYAEVNNSLKEQLISWTEGSASKPHVIIIGAATWSIKLHNGKSEALLQYKANLTAISDTLEKLAEHSEVYWVLQDPVYEDVLSDSRKMITNEQINLYNEAAVSTLNTSKKKIKFLEASRQAAMETISQSVDGLHLPESTRDVGAMVLMNSLCNKILKPIDGSCCQSAPPLSILQMLAAVLFLMAVVWFLVLGYSKHRKSRPVSDVESGEEKKPPAVGQLNSKGPLLAICKMSLIMLYFYLCDRADIFMKEQKFYTHSTFFIPLIYIFVLGIFYSENSKEAKLLNREQTDEWKGWMQLVILIYHISGASAFIPVYMHVRVLVAAYLFQTGYGHFSFFWLKGDFGLYRVCQVLFRLNFLVVVLCLVMDRPYQFYYFVPLVTFWFAVIYATMALWPQILQKQANVSKLFELQGSIHEWWFRWKLDRFAVINGMLFAFIYLLLQKCQLLSEGKGEPLFSNKISNCLLFVSVVSFMILAFILIRNIPGYARSLYSSFFAWFGKISLELFICQYHIWLAADTKGILVLIPGNPTLNIIVSTFIFVCVAHEISQITNDLAQVAIPKESGPLLKRLLGAGAFLVLVLILSRNE
ncbi:CAS1 domain-containing 1 [Labeo rohita]|uniref:N-acetylneuraminate (7)9-O-acetyltransferase n=1 Tax=Labeo rohita TaxID=84645 RepID=A0A498MVY5_LABRO|nr:CAS1 domain-containing 1 [Labeo rohita]